MIAPESHVSDEIRALLTPLQEMQQRHQQRLAAYKNADGDVIEEQYAEYDDARYESAIEASDTLDTVIKRLELLTTLPVRRAFTIAVNGPGHADGERPWLFVVHATDRIDGYQALIQLPSFQHWLIDTDTSHADAGLVPSECHPGTGASGTYLDLRHEQARTLAEQAPAPVVAAIPAQPAKPPCRSR